MVRIHFSAELLIVNIGFPWLGFDHPQLRAQSCRQRGSSIPLVFLDYSTAMPLMYTKFTVEPTFAPLVLNVLISVCPSSSCLRFDKKRHIIKRYNFTGVIYHQRRLKAREIDGASAQNFDNTRF